MARSEFVRRSRTEVLISILEALNTIDLKKTQIMYKCNISWPTLKEALDTLSEKHLIEKETSEKPRFYKITEKGIKVLEYQKKAQRSFE